MPHSKCAQDFEYADVGPNAGEAAPHVRFQLPGNLRKRSEYENVAPGINPEAERGLAREPEEKVSNFDDTLFSGDPTRLMPHLRAIHKMGMAASGSIGIEDIDALGQSAGTVRPRQVQRVMSELPADPGPGYEADHSSVGVAPSEPEGDGHGDIPIEEPTGQTSSKEIFKRSVGKTKHAEPPPPPGMSAARWDKILEGGPQPPEEELPPILTKMEDKKPVIEATDLIKRLEKRGYKLQGHTEVQGIPIAIENRAGSVRSGKDADGNEWHTKMAAMFDELEKIARHIFIVGVPASGKTTEAHRLERRTGMPVLHGDAIRSPNGTRPGTDELRSAIKKLKAPHIIEGVQVMGLLPEEVEGHDLRIIEPFKRTIIGRLSPRPRGRGPIEAPWRWRPKRRQVESPRPRGRGPIEAGRASCHGSRPCWVSAAERSRPH